MRCFQGKIKAFSHASLLNCKICCELDTELVHQTWGILGDFGTFVLLVGAINEQEKLLSELTATCTYEAFSQPFPAQTSDVCGSTVARRASRLQPNAFLSQSRRSMQGENKKMQQA